MRTEAAFDPWPYITKNNVKSVRWTRACECDGDATMGATRIQETKMSPNSLVVTISTFSGPSCDICGKPWIGALEFRP